tara:strand:- start:1854 stop:2159 length:306 start_codon:yes stop_codon:yes gene_type:complete
MKQTPYIRVGTSYYKEVKAPTIAGHFNEILVHWNMETIKQDHGKDHLSKIPKYDGFTCIQLHHFSELNFFISSMSFPKLYRTSSFLKQFGHLLLILILFLF